MNPMQWSISPVLNNSKFQPPSQVELRDTGAVNGGFGKYEVEKIAGRLVQFLRDNGDSWRIFSLRELADYYAHQGWDFYTALDGMTGGWMHLGNPYDMVMGPSDTGCFILSLLDGRFCVTEEFVKRVFRLEEFAPGVPLPTQGLLNLSMTPKAPTD